MHPKVSFIVPCYNLAHLLPDCLSSILSQTYGDFEVLLMDDCSPDHTAEVAQSFHDSRVRYVRNEINLGNIRNYNKAIELARAAYVWLISADDWLRQNYVLERYVQLMDEHPQVGYVFCPAVAIEDGRETGVMNSTAPFARDTTLSGRDFLPKLLEGNCVSAPAAMARRACYETVSLFPLDMPYAGDWYLWCAFAFHYDVAYFAEPMVNRRMHERNLTKYFMADGIHTYVANMIDVPWHMKAKAEAAGDANLAQQCQRAIVTAYITQILSISEPDASIDAALKVFEQSLDGHAKNRAEATAIRAMVYAGVADHYYWNDRCSQASQHYARALREYAWMPNIWAKYAFLRAGRFGAHLRASLGAIRRSVMGSPVL